MRSLEASEQLAERVLAWDGEDRCAHADDRPTPARSGRFPSTSNFAELANGCVADDPWRAALLAEAHVAVARRQALTRLRGLTSKRAFTLRGEGASIAPDAVISQLITEPDGPRREEVLRACRAAVSSLDAPSRAVIDAMRGAVGALDARVQSALGVGDDGDDLLAATDDLFLELDAWVRRGLTPGAERPTLTDRTRSLFAPAVLAAIPSATWASLGARPFERLGLDAALRGVVNELRPAGSTARGACVALVAPGHRALLAGRPTLAGYGLYDVVGKVFTAVAACMGKGILPGLRRGCDRAVDGLAHALGRRLLVERKFLSREAGVNGAPRERVMLEGLHGELARLRFDVAMSRFGAHVLAGRPRPGVCAHDALMQAWNASPPLEWGAWMAAQSFDAVGFWAGPHGAMSRGARLEPVVVDLLRAGFDDDWYRNPRAGPALAAIFEELRAVGLDAWCAARGVTADAQRTVTRLGEIALEARRAG